MKQFINNKKCFQDFEETPFRLVSKVPSCSTASHLKNTNFRGKLDKTGLPDKQGVLETVTEGSSKAGACVKSHSSVQSLSGLFTKGLPQGRCSILYKDGETAEALFKDGFIDGKVRHFSGEGRLQYVGLHRAGLPHGPVWIFPWSVDEEGAVLVMK